MNYVVHYAVGSILFLSITVFFYLRQRRIPNLRERIYTFMLLACLAALLFDFLAAVLDGAALPLWLLYVLNMLFILSLHCCLPAFFLYVLVLTGRWPLISNVLKGASLVPFVLVLLLTLLSPLGRFGIFYIDGQNIYHGGNAHALLYVVAILYVLAGTALLFNYRHLIPREKRVALFVLIGLFLGMMALQMTFPRYLLNTSALALGLTGLYHVLQSPGDRIDPVTGLFNRTALPMLLQDMMEQRRHFTLLIFSLRSFDLINRAFGATTGNRLQLAFAEYLKNAFPGRALLHLGSTSYAVLDTGQPMERSQLDRIPAAIPRYWRAANTDVQLYTGVAAVFGEDHEDVSQMLTTVDHVIQANRKSDKKEVLVADAAFREECRRRGQVEAALERLLENDEMELRFRPIFHADGRLFLLEAFAGAADPALKDVSGKWFLQVAEQTGRSGQFSRQLLERVCGFVWEGGLEKWETDCVCVRLSVAQCMREGAAEEILDMVTGWGAAPSQICFEVAESEAVSSLRMVRRNIKKLHKAGFSFLLDDFGAGYTDINLISELPFRCVKIDGSLLAAAMESRRQAALLAGMGDVLRRLDLNAVCTGVDTAVQATLLDNLGIMLRQGDYYQKRIF